MKQKFKNSIRNFKKNKDYVGADDPTVYAEFVKSNVGADDPVRPLRKRNTQKGITLVALVITIIVLLILAMVSIKIAIDGGLIGKSNEAVTIHEEAQMKESVQLAVAQCYMTKEGLTAENLKKALKENGIEESKIDSIDIANGKVTIDGKEYELEEKKNNNNSATEAKDYSYTEEEKNKMQEGLVAYNKNEFKAVGVINEVSGNYKTDPDTGCEKYDNYKEIELLIVIPGNEEETIMIPLNEKTATSLQNEVPDGVKVKVGKCYKSSSASHFIFVEEYTGKSPISKSDFTAEQIYCESYLDKVISNLNN